jgi:hypothetical protein
MEIASLLRLSVLGDKTGRRLARKKILEDSCPSAYGGRNLNNKIKINGSEKK